MSIPSLEFHLISYTPNFSKATTLSTLITLSTLLTMSLIKDSSVFFSASLIFCYGSCPWPCLFFLSGRSASDCYSSIEYPFSFAPLRCLDFFPSRLWREKSKCTLFNSYQKCSFLTLMVS